MTGRAALLIAALGLLGPSPAEAAKRRHLSVDAVTGVPASAGTFEGFGVRVRVVNRARRRAPAARVAFWLSSDARRGGTDLALGSRVRVKPLGRRAGTTLKPRIVLPAGARSGRHRVLACIGPKRCAASKPFAVTGAAPLRVAFARDEARARRYDDGETSRFSAVGADGTHYELELEGAEQEAVTALTLTPVTGIAPVPGSVAASGGVLIEPAGLLLTTPATLRIAPPGGAAQATTLAFGFGADGSEFRLEPARFGNEQVSDLGRRDVVAIDVRETGGYGIGAVPGGGARSARAAADPDLNLPAAPRHQLSQKVAATLQSGAVADVGPLICDYYASVVAPRLKAAETRGTREQVFPVISEALGVERQLQLLGTSQDASCAKDLFASLGKVVRRLLKEAEDACRAPGGNPLDETVELLTLARALALLGSISDEYVVAFDLCAPVYDLDYRTAYEHYGPEAWHSRGVATGVTRLDTFDAQTVAAPLDAPRPDVQFFEECAGDYESSTGTVRARALPVFEERYRPDGTIVVTGRLKVVTASDVDAIFNVSCEGDPSPYDLGGHQLQRSVLLPGEGGTGGVATGDDFAKPEPCNPDCVRAESTFTARPAAAP